MTDAGPSSAWVAAEPSAIDWILERGGSLGSTGFDVGGFADSVWVLNAMYERLAAVTGRTHDEALRDEVERGIRARQIVGTVDMTDVGVLTGGGLGWGVIPGPEYARLRWRDLAARTGGPLVPPGRYPSLRSLPDAHPSGSWPEHIRPPTEGSLDPLSWLTLTSTLAQHSPHGEDTQCIAYFTPWTGRDDDYLLQGRLADAVDLLTNHPGWPGSPQNLWPLDRSWFVFTDYDLWASRVSGPPALITALLANENIEAARIPESPGPDT
jgi:hypothetical protein